MKKILLMLAMMLPMAMFTACSKDDEEKESVDTTPISLLVDDTHRIEMNITPSKVSSENNFVASIDENGVVEGNHVGNTNVSINDKYTIPVEVKGNYHLYDDPVTEWGCSTSYIKENQKQGSLKTEDSDAIVYENCGNAEMITYLFENGKLNGVGVILNSSYTDEVALHLKERYMFITETNNVIMGVNSYKKELATTIATITLSDNLRYWVVIYMPYNYNAANLKSKALNDKRYVLINNIVEKLGLH